MTALLIIYLLIGFAIAGFWLHDTDGGASLPLHKQMLGVIVFMVFWLPLIISIVLWALWVRYRDHDDDPSAPPSTPPRSAP